MRRVEQLRTAIGKPTPQQADRILNPPGYNNKFNLDCSQGHALKQRSKRFRCLLSRTFRSDFALEVLIRTYGSDFHG